MLVEVETPALSWSEPITPERQHRFRRLAGHAAPYLYTVPALAGFGLWVYRPLVETVRYSFLNWNLLPNVPAISVGWANYHQILNLPQFRQALGTTGLYIGGMLLCGVVLPVIVGSLLQALPTRTRNVYRSILFLPALVSPIVAATIWSFFLAPNGGLANTIAGWIRIAPKNWLFDAGTARGAVIVIAGWKILGISILIVAAGLAAISPDYYEAAAIDGASRWRTFREVTLPLLSPTLLFLLTTSVLISESQVIFPLLNALTGGGPNNATSDIYYLLYQFGFTSFNVGLASAAAAIFFIAFSALAFVCVRLLDRLSFYDD